MKHEDQEFLSGLMDGEWQALDVRTSIARVCEDDALRAKWSRYHLARQAMRQESAVPGDALAARVSAAIADEPAYTNVTAIGGAAGSVASAPAATSNAADDGPGAGLAAEASTAAPIAVARVSGSSDAGVPRPATARTFAAGFGLAASVAVVTAFGLNALDGGTGGIAADPAAVAPTQVASSAPVPLAPLDAAPVVDPFSLQLPGAPLPNVELVANRRPDGAYWTDAESSTRRGDAEARLNMFLSQHIENSPTSERQGMLPYSRLVGYNELVTPAGTGTAAER